MPLGELTLIKNNKVVNYYFNKKTQKRYYQQILHGLDFLEDYSDNTDYSLLSFQNNKFIELNAEYPNEMEILVDNDGRNLDVISVECF